MERETTVSLVFGSEVFQKMFNHLRARTYFVEDLDLYKCKAHTDDEKNSHYTYRELQRYTSSGCTDKTATTTWDRKSVRYYKEQQVPHIDPTTERVIFITTSYKSATEDKLTRDQWQNTVRENHSDTECIRVANKHRLAFPPSSFVDLFDGRVPKFTRLSLGEYSTYGGTLEARTKCNPVYYLEIEQEIDHELVGPQEIGLHAERLVKILFKIIPYDLVAASMRLDAAATVQRERTDNIFDEFKRRFVNYNTSRDSLWNAVLSGERTVDEITIERSPSCDGDKTSTNTAAPATRSNLERSGLPVKLFVMPKWDGMKAVANYCEGHLFIRDACGSLSTYIVNLPFDNDLILQLELINDTDTGRRFFIITEIMAIVVKSYNTLYHVYNRNNTLADTGRYAGNVATSIALKRQFYDPDSNCNLYRLVAPLYSLLVIHYFSAYRRTQTPNENDSVDKRCSLQGGSIDEITERQKTAVNTYDRSNNPKVYFTTVAVAGLRDNIKHILRVLDRFHNYGPDGGQRRPRLLEDERANRLYCLRNLSRHLPHTVLQDPLFNRHSEGLLVAFVSNRPSDADTVSPPKLRYKNTRRPHTIDLPDHGYIKVKLVDTVDLEYHLNLGVATSASGKRSFHVRDVPPTFSNWAERSCPISNDRAIIECYYDRDRGCMAFLKDRPDKNKADSDEKIAAIDNDILTI